MRRILSACVNARSLSSTDRLVGFVFSDVDKFFLGSGPSDLSHIASEETFQFKVPIFILTFCFL